jgi:hypothetical protein
MRGDDPEAGSLVDQARPLVEGCDMEEDLSGPEAVASKRETHVEEVRPEALPGQIRS